MKIITISISVAAFMIAFLNFQARSDNIVSTVSTDTGWLVIYSGQGGMVGWTQQDTYANVSVIARLNGPAADQTGQAYLTTQVGPGTSVANQIASTNFNFPLQASSVVLFSGLQLPAGTYYLSIIGDSPTDGSEWMVGTTTNFTTGTGVTYFGAFGDTGVNAYYPASQPYSIGSPIEFTVQGIDITHPILQIAQNGNSILISWPTNTIGFGLESADSLTSTNWQPITQPIFTDSYNYLFFTNATGTQYYRLVK